MQKILQKTFKLDKTYFLKEDNVDIRIWVAFGGQSGRRINKQVASVF